MCRKPLQIIIFEKNNIVTGQVPYICAKLVVIVEVMNNYDATYTF